jgi:tRNA threonylcarbamoyladenosine modification (KEOPS) complex  Pcc1 subunit
MKSIIDYDCNSEHIIKLFEPEDKEFTNKRVSYKVEKTSTGVRFIINFKDITAFKAVISSITNLLIVYEKTVAIK